MWWKNILGNCVVLCLATVSATSSDNVTLDENRQPRVSGHIVKVYSGPKSDTSYCDGEGFKSDPSDCSVFYRCVRAGEGRYTVFRFQCGPGTIYDPDTEVCNHPRSTRRLECHGFVKPESDSHHENDVEFESIRYELPTPINKVSQPDIVNSFTEKIYETTATPWQTQATNKVEYLSSSPSLPRPISSQNHKENKKKDSICFTDGFVGDKDNCRTFYRCVNNGHGGFIRYEFSCSETTVWDEEAQSCNHPPLVKSRRCGQITDDVNESFTLQTPNRFGSRLPETTLKPNLDISPNNDSDNNYLPPHLQYPNSQQKQDKVTTLNPTINSEAPIVDEKQSYGMNDEDYDDPVSTSSTQRPTDQPTTQSHQDSSTKCKSSGFMADPDDCRKFYRCVDNGQGGYTVYEFTCGEGTVWDQSIEGCNHEWAVKDCKKQTGQAQTETTTLTTPTSTPQSSTSTTEENSNNQDSNKPQQTNEPTTSQSSTASSNPDTVCKYNGFIGDENDCKKFYRCVDNGNGGYTKYEFTCGEGTVWDSQIDSCNHAWAVEKCGGGSNTNINKETVTPSASSSPTETTQSNVDQTTKNEIEQPTEQPSTSAKPISDQNCKQEGFYGDNKDCKKFYRCVDNGNGGYTKYEFSCGDGTVWDQEIQSCNHPSSTKSCQSNTQMAPTTGVVQNSDPTTVQPQSSTEPDNNEPNTQKPESSPGCDSGGFYGDKNDCKKFYRCVDNGQGGYTKYEFSCGDGTVWDQNIQSCNHDTSNGKCSSSNQSEHSTTSSTPDNPQETTEGSQSTTPAQNDGQCDSEGFYANPNNCKKFYRCVSDGQGGYTKYDFDCGDGTVWVQEIQACDHDSDIKNCSSQSSTSEHNQNVEPPTESTLQTTAVSQSQTMSDEQPSENEPSSTSNGQCTSEGFYPDENNCHKFYRCVDDGNGGYTKYDFTCGEGTAWSSNIQSCDHESNVESCRNNNQETSPEASNEPNSDEYQTTQSTTTSSSSSSSTSKQPCNETSESNQDSSTDSSGSNEVTTSSTTTSTTTTTSTAHNQETKQDECTEEGFFGNSQDCTKFYRCVDNGKGGYTKYDFTCGEGTIWDQDITTCNHPQDVNNPSCTSNNSSSTMSPTSEQGSTQSSNESDSQTSSTTSTTESQSSNQTSDCSQESSSKKPESSKINCTKEGFYADPDDCKKFYRCVDWDGSGEKFSVFHFECGEGTIWDPQLDTCNYEDSVYPPRDCSGSQSQTESNEGNKTTTQSTTEKESTTQEATSESTTNSESTTAQESTTTEKQSTTSEATTEGTTTTEKQSTPTEQTTAQDTTTTVKQSTTTEQTTTQGTTTTEKQSTTTEQTTTQDTTTTEKQSTTTDQTTTQDTSTTEKQSTTTEQTTTQDTTTTEKQSTTTETQQSTTTTESSDMTTQQSTEGTTQQTTESNQQSTTTEQDATTEHSHSSNKCPDTDDDQYMFVCPSGFKRHPKYCNMFYQCSEDNDTHEVKIATFNCPNNTIYDENKNQCVEEDKADEKCDGEMAYKRRVKRLEMNSKEPLVIGTQRHSCPTVGHYPFEKEDECSSAFLKCERSKNGSIRGFIYRCPDNYIYWSVSRRCEHRGHLLNCKNTTSRWSGRWEIPVERKNVAH